MAGTVEDVILSSTEKTFQYQNDLLDLPVPDLSFTLKKYLDSVKPLVSEDDYKKTELIVKDFAQTEGEYLQGRLLEKAKTQRNWLEKWWEDVAYLELRYPAVFLNMGGVGPYGEDIWPSQPGSQIDRAGIMMYYILKYREYICREQMKPQRDNKGNPICMYQFRRIFNTVKNPGLVRDSLINYFKTDSEGGCPNNMIIISKGHIFSVNFFDKNGEINSVPTIREQFRQIREKSKKLGPAQGVNYLTSLNRTDWAKLRNRLVSIHPSNWETLEKIQQAVMVVGLEDDDCGDLSNQAYKSLLGDMSNRWLDKSMSMCAYQNGLVITNADHTPAEGLMMVFVTHYVHLKILECGGDWQGSPTVNGFDEPEHLSFVIDDVIKEGIETSKIGYQALQQIGSTHMLVYDKYGKDYCKAKRVHPDAVCQLAMQLAFFTINGRMAPTYETAPIKQFYHGRTETLRSCSEEAAVFCKAMRNPSVSKSEKYKLLVTAANKHNKLMAEAVDLKGCDRHLMGLALVAKEEGRALHDFYQDSSFTKSGGGGNYQLSTSCIGYTSVIGGVLPMCEQGIGCFYRINENRLTFYVTTWVGDSVTSSAFGNMVSSCLDEIKQLLDEKSSSLGARL